MKITFIKVKTKKKSSINNNNNENNIDNENNNNNNINNISEKIYNNVEEEQNNINNNNNNDNNNDNNNNQNTSKSINESDLFYDENKKDKNILSRNDLKKKKEVLNIDNLIIKIHNFEKENKISKEELDTLKFISEYEKDDENFTKNFDKKLLENNNL